MSDEHDLIKRLEAAGTISNAPPNHEVMAALGWGVTPHKRLGHAMRRRGESRWQAVARVTNSFDDAIRVTEELLRPLHPGMTVSLKAIYSGSSERPYWRAEITWPSHERQGRASEPALALVIALLRAVSQ